MSKSWIQSLGGKRLEPLALTREMVGPIDEIAHALAGKNRFTCQSRQRFSVAEHCVRGSELLPFAFAGAFLLHELSEVYLPDIAGPIKPFVRVYVDRDPVEGGTLRDLTDWSSLEKQHTRVILDALGLASLEPLIYSPEVKAMDRAMLVAEKRDLMGEPPEPWEEDKENVQPAAISQIIPWTATVAASSFVQRFHMLFGTPR